MALPAGLRALGHRDFRLFWCGQLVSLIGTWMQSVGQAWLVLELTNSPFRLGLIGALQFGPILLFSFLSGAISDRVRKRRLLLGTQTALMLQAFTLAVLVWSGHVQFWHVAVLAALYGLATTLDMPSRQAYIAHLVPRGDLMNAIALNSAVFNGARVVGPAVAGLLVARYGVALAFLLNGLSFLAVLGALRAMRTEGEPRPRTGATMFEDIAEGARYAAATPLIALILGLCCAVSLFVLNYNTLVPLIARDVLGEGAHGFGLLMASLGGGAVLGALVLARLDFERPPASLLLWAAMAASAATLSLAFVHRFWVAAPVLFVAGFAQILFAASSNTTLQMSAPDHLRGRMMSLYAWVFVGSAPIGALFIGSVAEQLGVVAACAAGGGCGLAAVAILAAWWKRRRA
jgi:MFS family permease